SRSFQQQQQQQEEPDPFLSDNNHQATFHSRPLPPRQQNMNRYHQNLEQPSCEPSYEPQRRHESLQEERPLAVPSGSVPSWKNEARGNYLFEHVADQNDN